MDLQVGKFRPIRVTGGHLQAPPSIRHKKCIINVRTIDDDCFKYRYPIIYIYIILNYTTTSLPSAAACMMHDYHGGSPPNTKIDYRNPKVIMI